MTYEQAKALDEKYLIHSYGRKPVELVSGQGMHVQDDAGNDYLDFIGGIGVCCLGHCHPAVVKAVRFGNRGYGNHVVLEHGGIECLYGHLSTILVREGDVIPAGAVVGISGNTGKSTGPHLHLQIHVDGKSIDPKPFVDALNGYIIRLQERIRDLKYG